MCARVCGATMMERLIDPLLSDVQIEYREARGQGRIWRSRWIRAAGYVALAKVVVVYGGARATHTLHDWPADDRRDLARTVWLSAGGMVVATSLLVWPPVHSGLRGLAVYLIPQGLPIAIPLGVTLGIFCGLGGRVRSSRLVGAVLAMALACSVASFATMAWIAPAANQAFLTAITERARLTTPGLPGPPKGRNEMTLGELCQQIDSLTAAGHVVGARNVTVMYQTRLALPCAAFVLALFALSVMPRRPVRRGVLAVAACGAGLAYFILLIAGNAAARQDTLPVFATVWLPNLLFALASAWALVRATASKADAYC
jgi:hypothetical protein